MQGNKIHSYLCLWKAFVEFARFRSFAPTLSSLNEKAPFKIEYEYSVQLTLSEDVVITDVRCT